MFADWVKMGREALDELRAIRLLLTELLAELKDRERV